MRERFLVERSIKVVRTQFKIGAWDGLDAGGMAADMAKIPAAAKLVGRAEDDNGDWTLVFELEQQDE